MIDNNVKRYLETHTHLLPCFCSLTGNASTTRTYATVPLRKIPNAYSSIAGKTALVGIGKHANKVCVFDFCMKDLSPQCFTCIMCCRDTECCVFLNVSHFAVNRVFRNDSIGPNAYFAGSKNY